MAKIYGALEVAQLEWFTDAGKPAASSYIYRVIYVSDLKQVMVSDGSNWIPFLNTSTNQTVNGNITFAGQQIFNGLHRLSVTTDSSSTGAVTALNNVTPVIEFTAAVTSVSGIVNSASGATVMLVNRTGGTIAVLDEDTGATAANRIRTGTGAQISLANNASIILTYVGDNRWHIVGGSGSGSGSAGINYITNGSAEADTLGWAVYADAAGTSPVDGTGGSANVTITRTTTTPLIGTASFLLAKDAANRQGQGWSYDFTIDLANRAKVLQISFDYLVSSGTFVAGATGSDSDVTVWIYDITNAVLIQPSNIKLFSNNASISDKFQASFQTASNSSNYRLILHVASTSASAYTLEVDGVSVAPSNYVFGTPITDWQDFPSVAAGTLITGVTTNPTYGTVAVNKAQWRRVGDSMEIFWEFKQTSTGTAGSGVYLFSLPSGYSIDSNKLINPSGDEAYASVGSGNIITSTTYGTMSVTVYNSTKLSFQTLFDGGGLSRLTWSSTNFNFTAGALVVTFTARVPIAGWSSSVQTSDSADTRVVAARATFSGSITVPTSSDTLINGYLLDFDTHGAFNITNGTYTVPVSGFYEVSSFAGYNSSAGTGAAAFLTRVFIDGVFVTDLGRCDTIATVYNSAAVVMNGTNQFNLKAGQVITIRAFQNSGSNKTLSFNNVNIKRLSGPSAIAASETVAASYGAATGQTLNDAVVSYIDFPTRAFDTHSIYAAPTGAYSAASGSWATTQPTWTIPTSGKYSIYTIINIGAMPALGTASYRDIQIFKNGVLAKLFIQSEASAGAYANSVSVYGVIQCNAGDTIQIKASKQTSGGGSKNLTSNVAYNYIEIYRVGN